MRQKCEWHSAWVKIALQPAGAWFWQPPVGTSFAMIAANALPGRQHADLQVWSCLLRAESAGVTLLRGSRDAIDEIRAWKSHSAGSWKTRGDFVQIPEDNGLLERNPLITCIKTSQMAMLNQHGDFLESYHGISEEKRIGLCSASC